jgi:hypothetical protein
MKESYGKDPASHPDPESCVDGREDAGEALTGAHPGQPLSSEISNRCDLSVSSVDISQSNFAVTAAPWRLA